MRWNASIKKVSDKGDNMKFIPSILNKFFNTLENINPENIVENEIIFCERIIELFIDLLSQVLLIYFIEIYKKIFKSFT